MRGRDRKRRDARLVALALAAGDLSRWHATLAPDDAYSRGLRDAYDDCARVLTDVLEIGGDREQTLPGQG